MSRVRETRSNSPSRRRSFERHRPCSRAAHARGTSPRNVAPIVGGGFNTVMPAGPGQRCAKSTAMSATCNEPSTAISVRSPRVTVTSASPTFARSRSLALLRFHRCALRVRRGEAREPECVAVACELGQDIHRVDRVDIAERERPQADGHGETVDRSSRIDNIATGCARWAVARWAVFQTRRY